MLALLLALPTFAQKDKDHDFKVAKNMDVFNAIYKNLDMMYVDTLNADEVIGYGIKAMLGSLDPYTTYYPESDQKELKRMLTGKYAGVGSLIRYNNQLQTVVIDEPYENMPAAEAGLKRVMSSFPLQILPWLARKCHTSATTSVVNQVRPLSSKSKDRARARR